MNADDKNDITCSIADCAACQTRGDSVFNELRQGDLELLARERTCRNYRHGELILSPEDEPSGLFCILEGKVQLYKRGRNGKEQVVRLAAAGDVVGYRALVAGERYGSWAEAIDHARICHVPRDVFFSILNTNAAFATRLMALISTELRNAEEKIVELAHRPVRERVAETLLMLIQTYGLTADQMTINVTMTRGELASVVGTAMESVSRQLSYFRQEGIIELVGRKIRVLNQRALVEAANLDE